MIDKDQLRTVIESALAETPMFLTELSVSPSNDITVEVDSDEPMDISACEQLTRTIEGAFDRDAEDYSLEVGSAGLTAPLRLRRQFVKYIGKDLEVLTTDGRKLHGVLTAVEPSEQQSPVRFTLEVPTKVKEPGAKRPVVKQEPVELSTDTCKLVRYDLKF